ncbi:hypothetical protein CVM73_25100 [Bradyrhizobium forestalis]|uniref:Uncharacterized protein n=1 Tax=Bradyrhizobium forestalis TaxID=1419263 RepID=A0A2M8R3P3_9BRAD|nr:hypothetical protein [Bradyrhizobium forestalis]PJG52453.1 hypothetical protein CVM73_25100 [Bradyrhizobium forestalis]
MESASVPETNDPKPDTGKPDAVTPDAVKPGEARADGGLARAYDRIKSAEEDLARLDRLVSGMERDNEGPRASHASLGAIAAATPGNKAPTPDAEVPNAKVSNAKPRDQGLKGDRTMMRALAGLVLAVGLLGAAFASQYRDEARSISMSIMARWAPPAASSTAQASAAEGPAQPPAVLLAAADEPSPVPAPPVAKETDSTPKPGATAPEASSSELAQSLKAITSELANISGKLEQLKSRNEQTLREQADTIQQLKTAQEKDAADNARLAAQVQALQTQLSASSASSAPAGAKPVVRSVNNDTAARARAHVPDAAPRRPRPPPRGPWMPPPYMADPYYGDPDW